MKYPYKITFGATALTVMLFTFNSVYAQSAETSESTDVTDDAADIATDDAADDIRVRQAGTTTVKEFHQQGRVYKVEVAPKNTPAYILSDQDGNGSLNSSDTGIDNDLVLPEWTLGNW